MCAGCREVLGAIVATVFIVSLIALGVLYEIARRRKTEGRRWMD